MGCSGGKRGDSLCSGQGLPCLHEGPAMIVLQEIEDIASNAATKAPEGSAPRVDHKAGSGILVVRQWAMGLQSLSHGPLAERHSAATDHVFNGVGVLDLFDVCLLNRHHACPSTSSGMIPLRRTEVI